MENIVKVIYIGITDDHLTHLKEYRILSAYSNGSILVMNDKRCKSVLYKGSYVLKD